MGARNRGGIRLSYRPTRLHRLAEFIPWNRFLGSINVNKYGLRLPVLLYCFFIVKAIAVTAVFRLVSTKVDPRQPLEGDDDPLLLNR